MPPARRKTVLATLDAKTLLPTGKRSDPVGSVSLQRAMQQPASGTDDLAARPGVRARLVDWHGAVAQVSGTLTLAVCKRGLSMEAGTALVAQLRLIADDMERRFRN